MTIEEILIDDSDDFTTGPQATTSGPAYTFHDHPGLSRANSIVIDDDVDCDESRSLFALPPQQSTIPSSPPVGAASYEFDEFDEFDSTPLKPSEPKAPTLALSPKRSFYQSKRTQSSPLISQAASNSAATIIENEYQDGLSSDVLFVENSFTMDQVQPKSNAQFTVVDEEDLFVISSSLQTVNLPPRQEIKKKSPNKVEDWENAFIDSTDDDTSNIDGPMSEFDGSRTVANITRSLDVESPAAKVLNTRGPNASAAKRSSTLPTNPITDVAKPVTVARSQRASKTSEEKEREKRTRAKQREEAVAEKKRRKELDQANKQRRTRQESAKEMILDIAGDFHDNEIGLKIRADLNAAGSEVKKWNKPVAEWTPLRIRRKVTAKYDTEEDIYKPCALEVTVENRAFVYIDGSSFVGIIRSCSIDKHVADIRAVFPTQKIVYIIEGLDTIIRKSEQAKNRAYANRVRQLMGSPGTETSSNRPTRASHERSLASANEDEVTKSRLEKLLVHFQLELGFQLIQPANGLESADWIVDLVQCVSQKPYKTTKLLGDEIIDIVGIRSGKDVFDTYLKSLQQIKYVTPSISQSISAVYPSSHDLMTKLFARGPAALSGIQKTNATGKRAAVGKQLAENITRIFMSKNPDEYLDRNM